MTDETTPASPYPDGQGTYLAFNIESMPYSTIHVAFADFATIGDAVAFAVEVAQSLEAAYSEAGLRVQRPTAPPATGNQNRPASGGAGRPSGAGGGARGAAGAAAPPPIAYCKEHRVGMKVSIGNMNRDGDNLYHPLPQEQWYRKDGDPNKSMVKFHSLYWRETVNREGVSNEGVPMPGLQGGGAPPRTAQRPAGYGGRAPVQQLPERDVDADAYVPLGTDTGWGDDLPF